MVHVGIASNDFGFNSDALRWAISCLVFLRGFPVNLHKLGIVHIRAECGLDSDEIGTVTI